MEGILTREIALSKKANRVIVVIISVIFMSLGAFVRIPLPFSPVPLTLQTFFVLLSASAVGVTPQAIYLLLGITGIPLFTQAGSGMLYLLGPTGGYLAGFVLAALFISPALKSAGGNLPRILSIFILADLVILACGTFWLRLFLGGSWIRASLAGFLPFIPGDLLKVVAAAACYLKLRPRLKQIF